MEYYKELFFKKIKHSYDLHEIDFYNDSVDGVFTYKNVPSKGFKLVANNFLDPISGYIFHPENSLIFKDLLIKRNLLINGVCIKPIIFEYLKDGSFNVHIYDDVKDELEEVKMSEKVSLSNSNPGDILRNVKDESYYIYLGLVGQYYVSKKAKTGVVKKKHLVLKTDAVDAAEDSAVFTVHRLSYVNYTKDKDDDYVCVKKVLPENLKIKFYYYYQDDIHIGKYISDNIFNVTAFQQDYPSFLLSGTIRRLFPKNDISLTMNKVSVEYDYVGEVSLEMLYKVDYKGVDIGSRTLMDATIEAEIMSTNDNSVDFNEYTYATEFNGEKYIISHRSLTEIDCFGAYYERGMELFQGYDNISLHFYKMKGPVISGTGHYYYRYGSHRNSRTSSDAVDWTKPIKLWRVYYALNKGKVEHNVFVNKKYTSGKIKSLIALTPEIFDTIRTDKGIRIHLVGAP